MKRKFTLLLSFLMMAVFSVSAEVVTVWEGSVAGNLNFFADGNDQEVANYNALMGSAAGQANLSAGDVITIYYTGADEDKLWLQDKEWSTYGSSITGVATDLLTDGDGTFVINVKQEFVDAIKMTGLRMRRGNQPVFSFVKVTVTKGSQGGGQGGGEGEGGSASGSVTIWEGSSAEGSLYFAPESTEFNKIFGDGKNQANVKEGDKLRFYYTGAASEAQIWVQANWDGVNIDGSTPTLTEGDGYAEFTLTDAAIALFKTNGIRFRRPNGSVYTLTKIEIIKAKEDTGSADGVFAIWEGTSSEGSLYFAPESAEYNKVFGDGKNQAGAKEGDVLRFYYTGAAGESQIWVQANWDGVNIDGSTPTLADGDGYAEFVLTANAVDLFKANGIRFRRPNGAVYTLTKIEIIKEKTDPSVVKPGANEVIVWSGNENKDYTMSFRYDPTKSDLVSKIAVGKYFNLYLSNVEEGDKVYFKECKDWSYLNDGRTELKAGEQVFSFEITSDWYNKISEGGMVLQQHDGEATYDYTFRYLTVSDAPIATGIHVVTVKNHAAKGVYNLAGQRIGDDAKGLLIVDGKKVIRR